MSSAPPSKPPQTVDGALQALLSKSRGGASGSDGPSEGGVPPYSTALMSALVAGSKVKGASRPSCGWLCRRISAVWKGCLGLLRVWPWEGSVSVTVPWYRACAIVALLSLLRRL